MKEYTGYSLKNNKEVYVFWDEKLINGTIHIVYNREEKLHPQINPCVLMFKKREKMLYIQEFQSMEKELGMGTIAFTILKEIAHAYDFEGIEGLLKPNPGHHEDLKRFYRHQQCEIGENMFYWYVNQS